MRLLISDESWSVKFSSGGSEGRVVLGAPLVTGVVLRASGADFHEDTVASCPLQLSQHPQYLSVDRE